MLKGERDIGLRPAIITPITKVNVVDFWLHQEILLVVMGELNIYPISATLPPKEEILGEMVQDVGVGLKRSTNVTC